MGVRCLWRRGLPRHGHRLAADLCARSRLDEPNFPRRGRDQSHGSRRSLWPLELLRLAHGLGPGFVYGLVKTTGHMLSITANIMFGDLVDGVSTLVGSMPGTGKTRCVAMISILVAGVGKRKVLFASLQNEPVRSMMISVEERLAESVTQEMTMANVSPSPSVDIQSDTAHLQL